MSALRVGYTCHDAFPSTDTNTQQIFWTLSEVARLGHAVELSVPALRGGSGARTLIARHYGAPDAEIPDGLQIVARGEAAPAGPLAVALFDLLAPRRFTAATHDVIWTRDPLAAIAAVRTGVPTVFETYRPDFAAAPAFAAWRWLALRSLRGVITHSRLAGDSFVEAGVPRERCLVAHNGHAPALMAPVFTKEEARAATGLPLGTPLVVYTGHVGPTKGTDALVALAAAVPEIRMVIVGVEQDSREREWLDARAAAAGAANIIAVPHVPLPEVARYMYAADCLIVPPTDEPLTRYRRTVLPMKVFSYMAAGRPMLAPATPDIREILSEDNAVLVPAGDVCAAAAALRALLADPATGARLAAAARAAAAGFTWEARARLIAGALERWIR